VLVKLPNSISRGHRLRAKFSRFAEVVASWDVIRLALIRHVEIALKIRSLRFWDARVVDKINRNLFGESLYIPPVELDFVDARRAGFRVHIPLFRAKLPMPHIQSGQFGAIGVKNGLIGCKREVFGKGCWMGVWNLEFYLISLAFFFAAVNGVTFEQVPYLRVTDVPDKAFALGIGVV